ncbi:hypothetical protein [Amycolatopsis sp. lyj-84]|uniref:hypothetical protein n=1 Tax=Amycolatopsis sp. lyj-84 TaxID=2789284 RepID=UPI00397BB1B5
MTETDVFSVVIPDVPLVDVVFLHGLGGDARKTWAAGEAFWPDWLGQDVAGVAVWSVDYAASPSGWLGRAMPIQGRAVNILAALQNAGVGERPLVFVTHSMGGLLAKQMLRHADSSPTYASFATAARGVVFLATPHIGADMAKVLNRLKTVLRTTAAGKDLQRNAAHLRDLNLWYRNWALKTSIRNLVFYEAYPTFGVHIVDAGSADPGLAGADPIPIDADHSTICKPTSRTTLVYGQVQRFLTSIRDTIPTADPDTTLPSTRDAVSRTADKASGSWPVPPRGAGYRFEAFGRPVPRPASYQHAPSYLLDSRYEVVPFRDRGERQVLEDWLDDPAPRTSVQLVHGEGGLGKTRLAMQVARRAAESGWHVIQAFERAGSAVPRGERAVAGRLLVVVDYAERWTVDVLERMVLDLADHAGVRCLRVLLLTRLDYGLWDLITSTMDRQVDHLAVPVRLGRFTTSAPELTTAFNSAVAAFQSAMQLQPVELVAPRTWQGTGRSPLGLHMAALAAVWAHENRRAVPSDADLSEFLLTHERKYWSAGLAVGLPALEASAQVNLVSRTVLVATLFGSLTNSADARQLLRAAHLADSAADAQSLIDRHAQLYPAEPVSTTRGRAVSPHLRPLHPDRFAEDFVAWCVRRPADRALTLDLIREVTSSGTEKLQRRALAFLATTAARHPDVDELLDELLGTLDAYVHVNSRGVAYYLHRTEVTLRGGKPQTIYFFAKVRVNAQGEPTALPKDRIVRENPRNGFLTISKKKDDPPEKEDVAATV